MKTTSLKDILELAGIAAVVLGLVLVAYELRQNNEQLAEQSRQSVADGVRQITLSVATSPELARLLSREVSLEEMTGSERMQFAAWFVAWLKSAEHAFIQHQDGILDDEIWLARQNQAIGMLEREKFDYLYQTNKDVFVPAFIAHFDEVLKDRQAR